MRNNPISSADQLKNITACAARIVQRGWDEATGGNLSVACEEYPASWNVSLELPDSLQDEYSAPSLLVTTSGKHWRDLAAVPESRLVHVSADAVPQLHAHPAAAGMRPTLELRIHLAVQSEMRRLGWESCAVLHIHPPALLALSTLPASDAAAALSALPWLFPEGAMLLGESAALIPYMPPGSDELAAATAEALTKSRIAVWQNHGVITAATSLGQALDVLETAELAAEVYLRCRQAGFAPQLIKRDGSCPPPADTTR